MTDCSALGLTRQFLGLVMSFRASAKTSTGNRRRRSGRSPKWSAAVSPVSSPGRRNVDEWPSCAPHSRVGEVWLGCAAVAVGAEHELHPLLANAAFVSRPGHHVGGVPIGI